MPDYKNYNARKNGEYKKIWQSTGKCVFCDLKDKYIIKKGKYAALTVNLFPYQDGHLMVIPYRHFEKYEEMDAYEWSEMQELANFGMDKLRKKLDIGDVWILFRAPSGYRAGKSVSHAHLHLIPYEDGNVEWKYKDIEIPPEELANRLRNNDVN